MEHQNGEIPEHLQTQWQEVTEELRLASERLNEASREYQSAILARIALSELLQK